MEILKVESLGEMHYAHLCCVSNSLFHRGHQYALELSVAGQQFWAPLSYLFEVH